MIIIIKHYVQTVLAKMTKAKLIGSVFLVILLIPLASALTKPIAGKLEFENNIEQLEIKLYVEVDFLSDENHTCTINPTVKNGLDGSFSTNLDNLIFEDFPSLRCNSFWKAGDKIWYETNYRDNLFKSNTQEIELGTGLQLLDPLKIPSPEEELPPSPGEDSGGGGGGNIPGLPEKEEVEPPSKETIKLKPEILAKLSIEQKKELIEAAVLLELLNNIKGDISLKLILFSLPNSDVIKTINDDFLLKKSVEKEYPINLNEFKDGWYKLQTFVYFEDELIAVSNDEEFFIKRKLIEEKPIEEKLIKKEIELPKRIIALPSILCGISFIIILIVIFFILARKKEEKEKEKK